MGKIAVIYKSHYGTTKTYAKWIAEELNADLFERKAVKPADLAAYDTVVYGGGLYAGGILGVDIVAKSTVKNLIIFTVGLANPALTDYSEILNKNLPENILNGAKIFHLRGGIDYSKLSFAHKGMMAMMKKITEKKGDAEKTDEDLELLRTYGSVVDFTDKSTIKPLVEYVKGV